jgi:hypothetical protein
LVFSLPALAVEPGQPLFVSVNDAALRDQPKDKARKLTTLRAGEQVTWNGVSDVDRRFQRVTTAQGKPGFLLTSELTPNRPQLELDLTGKPMPGLATSGFTKCDMGGSASAPASPQAEAARAQLEEVEALNRAAATPEALAKKRQDLSR